MTKIWFEAEVEEEYCGECPAKDHHTVYAHCRYYLDSEWYTSLEVEYSYQGAVYLTKCRRLDICKKEALVGVEAYIVQTNDNGKGFIGGYKEPQVKEFYPAGAHITIIQRKEGGDE